MNYLQAAAYVAALVAAIIAGAAALVAFFSFRQQKSTGEAQHGLAIEQLKLAHEQGDRQQGLADLQGRIAEEQLALAQKSASMDHLLRFRAEWEGSTMLQWRAQLAQGLIAKRSSGAGLSNESRVGLDHVGNLMDIVGYCVETGLIKDKDAWELFSAVWEIYWDQNRDVIRQADSTVWTHASSLLTRFAELTESEGGMRADEPEIAAFLNTESHLARVERRVQAEE